MTIDFNSDSELTLTDLYETYEYALTGYAVSLTRDPDRAADLVQETFIRAMPQLALLAQLNSFQRRAWLRRVLKNLFLDELRSSRREQTLIDGLGEEFQEINPEPNLQSEELLALLPESDRQLIRQHYFLGLTSEEIGQELGIPAATVRSRLHLAIKRLRARQSEFR